MTLDAGEEKGGGLATTDLAIGGLCVGVGGGISRRRGGRGRGRWLLASGAMPTRRRRRLWGEGEGDYG